MMAVQRNLGTVNTNPYQSTTQPVPGDTGTPQRLATNPTQSAFPSTPAPTPTAPAQQQQASTSGATGGTTQYNGGLNDDNGITAWIASQAGGAGINPSVGSDPAYWLRRIKETGGLSNANTDYWIGLMKRPEGAPEGGGGGGVGGGAYVPGQGVPGQGTIFGAGQGVNPQVSALEQQLLQRAGQDVTPNAKDPIIKNQVDAFNAQQQQASRNYLSGVAEKAGPNSNIGAETRLANQQVGQATGGFEAQLMGQELSARRQEVQQALQGEQGLLTAEQQMQLQEELQQLNLAQGAYQSDRQFAYLNSPLASGAMTG